MTDPSPRRDAARRILAEIPRQPTLRIPLDDALGSALAEDVVSPIDIPAWANSAMDGYAARAGDVRGASAERRCASAWSSISRPATFLPGPSAPASAPDLHRSAGTRWRRSVIRQEDTDGGGDVVAITSDRDAGTNIRQAGEDIRRGTTVLRLGYQLEPAQLGVLASLAVPIRWCTAARGWPSSAAATRSPTSTSPRRS